MPNVQSTPLFCMSSQTPLGDAIHTLKDTSNCHWWIKCGSVIIDPTSAYPVHEYAVSPELMYFPFNKEDTTLLLSEWGKMRPPGCYGGATLAQFLTERARTGDYKHGQCYWNALAKCPPHGELVCGAV